MSKVENNNKILDFRCILGHRTDRVGCDNKSSIWAGFGRVNPLTWSRPDPNILFLLLPWLWVLWRIRCCQYSVSHLNPTSSCFTLSRDALLWRHQIFYFLFLLKYKFLTRFMQSNELCFYDFKGMLKWYINRTWQQQNKLFNLAQTTFQ